MVVLLILSTCVLAWAAWQAALLASSYREARTIGLPIIVSPTTTMNPLWLVATRLTPVARLCEQLPLHLGRWARVAYMGWQYDDKGAIHREVGPAFVLCTPGRNEIHLADPSAVHTVLRQRKDFVKPTVLYELLDVFGRNVDSVEGETWQRHRKLTAPSFNEHVSSTVWSEATRQAAQMLQAWTKRGARGTTRSAHDTATLALHVLTCAGLGISYNFSEDGQADKADEGTAQHRKLIRSPHKLSYRDALNTVLRNFNVFAVLPKKVLGYPFLPANLQRVGEACREFELYMKELVQEEKKKKKKKNKAMNSEQTAPGASTGGGGGGDGGGDGGGGNLLQALIRASDTAWEKAASPGRAGLTDDELYGNLFIYNMAGHETTANALATAVAFLAAQPGWQDWLHEEIQQTASTFGPHPQEWAYEDAYPLLVRCQAVLLETLRLNGSVVFIPKSTPKDGAVPVTRLSIAGRQHTIPANTWVIINSQALHCDPNSWGADALVWRPSRWLVKKQAPTAQDEQRADAVSVFEPPEGTYVPWAAGPRACPGKKFAQVEFAGVLAVLFARHRVRPRREAGESEGESLRRAQRVVEDSALDSITLQMKHPERVALVWTERGRACCGGQVT